MKEKLNCIMVIDDDEPTNFISTMLIEEADCTQHLEIVDSGLKALNYLGNASAYGKERIFPVLPGLVFLDINMPAWMDGSSWMNTER